MTEKPFKPHMNILPRQQRSLWPELIDVPEEFTLYGGTAIALHLGHRESVDFDFFGTTAFDPDHLIKNISFLKEAEVLQKEENTLTCLIDRGGPVQVSFFGLPEIKQVAEFAVASDISLKVASLVDLAGTKVAVVQKRAQIKDYLDIDALITHGVDLSTALAAGKAIYGRQFNPQITLKALSYFEDGNLITLPKTVKRRIQDALLAVDLDKLPVLTAIHGDKKKSKEPKR